MTTDVRLIHGSALHIPLDDESVQCVVTSPPYWGLRQYAGEQREVWGGDPTHAHEWGVERVITSQPQATNGAHTRGIEAASKGRSFTASTGAFCTCGAWYGALGLEPTPELYVEHIVAIFREVRRVLRKDGTLWLNLGDSYFGTGKGPTHPTGFHAGDNGGSFPVSGVYSHPVIKQKDLVGIPWMVAFALRADGWYLRSDIIWHKPNPMPESATDRPTKSHEYLFLLTKSERYYYDADAIREPMAEASADRYRYAFTGAPEGALIVPGDEKGQRTRPDGMRESTAGRNKRTVWTIPTRPYKGAHFATFPPDLVEPCVLAGSSPKACCVCGAPWERLVEKGEPELQAWSAKGAGQYDDSIGAMRRTSLADGSTLRHTVPRTTAGWRSTCDHDDDSGACVVLDPFNGSGTTGQVAVRLGRSYVGVDISKEYLEEQAVRRIYDVQMEAVL